MTGFKNCKSAIQEFFILLKSPRNGIQLILLTLIFKDHRRKGTLEREFGGIIRSILFSQ